MSIFILIFRKQMKAMLNNRYQQALPLVFLFMFNFLLILVFESHVTSNSSILYWAVINLLLSNILVSNNFFKQDFQSGMLEILILNPKRLTYYINTKLLSYYLLFTLPSLVITLLCFSGLGIEKSLMQFVLVLLLIGPTFLVISAIGAALALASNNSNVLIPILMMPFYIPLILMALKFIDNINFYDVQQGFLALVVAAFLLSVSMGHKLISLLITANFK